MKVLVILANLIFIIISILSILLAITSVFLFDAPGSENNPYVWGMFLSALALPIACFVSVPVSLYISFKKKNYKKALLIFLLPIIVIAILLVNMSLNDIFCNGSFSCPHA